MRTLRERLRRGGPETGATTELVITFPVLLLLILVIVQGGLWFHARNVALTAAQEGARSARVYDGSQAAGQATAQAIIDGSGNLFDVDPTIESWRDPAAGVAGVRVSGGSIASLVPGLDISLGTQVSEGPVEQFRSGL
jgi:hypothetical protein